MPAQLRSTNASPARRLLRVDPARQHRLAGAGLAVDQQRAVGAQHRLASSRAARGWRALSPRNGSTRLRRIALRRAGQRLLPVALVLEDALDDDEQRVELHRLGEELLGAELHRFDGGVDRRERGEHDERASVRWRGIGDQVERRAVGQAEVEDGDVGTKARNFARAEAQSLRLFDVEVRAT